jgi:hypothetical protein
VRARTEALGFVHSLRAELAKNSAAADAAQAPPNGADPRSEPVRKSGAKSLQGIYQECARLLAVGDGRILMSDADTSELELVDDIPDTPGELLQCLQRLHSHVAQVMGEVSAHVTFCNKAYDAVAGVARSDFHQASSTVTFECREQGCNAMLRANNVQAHLKDHHSDLVRRQDLPNTDRTSCMITACVYALSQASHGVDAVAVRDLGSIASWPVSWCPTQHGIRDGDPTDIQVQRWMMACMSDPSERNLRSMRQALGLAAIRGYRAGEVMTQLTNSIPQVIQGYTRTLRGPAACAQC